MKPGIGSLFCIVIFLDVVFVAPSLSVIVNVTVYVPSSLYLCVVFCSVDVFPSPNSQYHVSIVPSGSVDRSVNCIVSRSVGLIGFHVKLAIGSLFNTVI